MQQQVSLCEFNHAINFQYSDLPTRLKPNVQQWHIGDSVTNTPIFIGSFFFIEALQKSDYN